MKALLALTFVFLGHWALAEDLSCVVDGVDVSNNIDKIVEGIKATKNCGQAENLASACAYGSTIDGVIAGNAADKCGEDLDKNKATKEDRKLLTAMYNACNSKYSGKEGSIYISFNAFCQLEAIKWVVDLTAENSDL